MLPARLPVDVIIMIGVGGSHCTSTGSPVAAAALVVGVEPERGYVVVIEVAGQVLQE